MIKRSLTILVRTYATVFYRMHFTMVSSRLSLGSRLLSRTYAISSKNPFARTWDIISKEIPPLFGKGKKAVFYPEHADIVIIGGGYIGSSVAYWLKTRAGAGLSIVVLEKDPTYAAARNNLTLGTLTQHYSLPENIELSLFAADFLRNAKTNLNQDIDLEYFPHSHLILASERFAAKLEENVVIMKEFGVRNNILSVEDINSRFPWINTDDVHLGCIGSESEGTFNSWNFLKGLVQKSVELGTTYVKAEVTGFELEEQKDMMMEGIAPGSFKKINRVVYKTDDGEEHGLKFAACILAAGDKTSDIAKLANVGTGDGLLKVGLPIKTRESKIFSIEECAHKTGLDTPIITDTSGLWLRRNGLHNNLLCGHAPITTVDVNENDEHDYIHKIIRPSLDNRIPNCKDDKVRPFHTEQYDCNTFDETGILGPHPYHNTLIIAAGFGRNGCCHAPGIGRGIAELIIDSHFTTIDLTRFTFDRLLTGQSLVEFNIY